MKPFRRFRFGVAALAGVTAISGSCGGAPVIASHPVPAQGLGDLAFMEREVKITHAERASLVTALKSLARQSGTHFFCDAPPLRTRLSKDAVNKLASEPETMSVADALDKICDDYGYFYSHRATPRDARGTSHIVFRHKFVDDTVLPNVTPAECTRLLKNAFAIIGDFDPKLGPPGSPRTMQALTSDVYDALTPEQQAAIQNKKLRVAELTTAQQTLVRRNAMHVFITEGGFDLNVALFNLQALPQTVFTLNERDELVCAPRKTTQAGGASMAFNFEEAAPGLISITRITDGGPPDSSLPKAFPEGGPTLAVDEASQSFADVVKARNADAPGDDILDLDSALAEKRVIVVSPGERPDTAQVISGLSELAGGVHVEEETIGGNRHRQIVPLRARAASRPDTIASEIIRVMPSGFHQYVYQSRGTVLPPTRFYTRIDGTIAPDEKAAVKELAALRAAGPASGPRRDMERLRLQAGRQLRLHFNDLVKKANAANPAANKNEAPQIAFNELPPQAQRLAALAMMARSLRPLRDNFLQNPPPYVARFGELYVSGGPYKDKGGKSKIGMSLLLQQPDGSLAGQTGVSDVDYAPPPARP